MYIIAIGWLWVVLLMAITESNLVASILTFAFYGLFPCALLMWLLSTPSRRARNRARATFEIAETDAAASENGRVTEKPTESPLAP